jgi:hypothetical protein
LQISEQLFIAQNVPNIVLNIPVLAFKSYPFASQKVCFDLAKGILWEYERIPFAKLKVKNGDFGP